MALVKEKYLKTKYHLGYGRTVFEFGGKSYDVFPHYKGGYGVCIEGEHTSTATHYPDISSDSVAVCVHLGLSHDKYQESLWAA